MAWTHKSKKMRAVEDRYGSQLEYLLPSMITKYGQKETATRFGIRVKLLYYWMRKFEIEVARIAVPPGYEPVLQLIKDTQLNEVTAEID